MILNTFKENNNRKKMEFRGCPVCNDKFMSVTNRYPKRIYRCSNYHTWEIDTSTGAVVISNTQSEPIVFKDQQMCHTCPICSSTYITITNCHPIVTCTCPNNHVWMVDIS